MRLSDTFRAALLLVKNLLDGSKAVGLFNRGKSATEVKVDWSELHITGKHTVRDLWREKDLGNFTQRFRTTIPSQGVVMVNIGR